MIFDGKDTKKLKIEDWKMKIICRKRVKSVKMVTRTEINALAVSEKCRKFAACKDTHNQTSPPQ